MNIYILIFICLCYILPICFFIFIFILRKEILFSFFQILFLKNSSNPFSVSDKKSFSDKLVFVPHPFLNWSLNPHYKNKNNEYVHTSEGFRKTFDESSILKYLENTNHDSFKIVCIGGSTTHCGDMEDYRDSWPAVLHRKLNLKEKCTVINFGVGAWNTIQSQIRCLTYLNKIKPNLLLFYHAKNDLTPLMNGNLKEKLIMPDLQNIMAQFSERYFINHPLFLFLFPLISIIYFYKYTNFSKIGLLNIYKPNPAQNPEGMSRLNDDFLESIIYRQKNIIKLCQDIKCRVLYLPEIVTDGIYRDILFENLYPKLIDVIDKENNTVVYNIDSLIPKTSNYFWDKMHFTKDGNKLFAEILTNKIIKDYLN